MVKITGRSYWLWRAVDQNCVVLEEILQSKRDKRAAKELLVNLMKRWGFAPKRIIPDKRRSYGAAKREIAPGLDHWSLKGLTIVLKTDTFRSGSENGDAGLLIAGRVPAFRLHAFRNPKSLLCPNPLPLRSHYPISSLGSIRRLESCGPSCLISPDPRDLRLGLDNVTTPADDMQLGVHAALGSADQACTPPFVGELIPLT